MKTILLLIATLLIAPAYAQGQFIPYDTSSPHAKKRIADFAKLRAAFSPADKEYLRALSAKYRPLLIEARNAGEPEEMERLRSEQFAELTKNLSPNGLKALLAAKNEK